MKLSDLYYLNRHDRRILLILLTVAVVALTLMFLVLFVVVFQIVEE